MGSSTPLVGNFRNKKRAGNKTQPSFVWFKMWEISWQRRLNGKSGIAHIASDDIAGRVSQDNFYLAFRF